MAKVAPRHTKEPLIITPDPEFPFQDVAADFFSVKGHSYLVLVDRYSGWFTVSYFQPHQATSCNLIHECVAMFSAYGAPEVLSSDGGPQFTSQEFKLFLGNWNIRHRLSSPEYPQSNGRAEAAVKTAKRIISNYVSDTEPYNHEKIARAIIQHRNTPLPDLKLSPAQLLFHRRLRDQIPTHPHHLRLHKKWILSSIQRENLFRTKNIAMQQRYDQVSRTLDPLDPQTKVLVLTPRKGSRWTRSGIVVMKLPFRQYKIRLDGSGRIVIRNRRFLRRYNHKHAALPEDENGYPSLTPNLSDESPLSQTTPLPSYENDLTYTSQTDIPRNLLPHNKPGRLEESCQYQHRTTRSNRQY